MRRLLFVLLLSWCVGAWAQNSSGSSSSPDPSTPANAAPSNSQTPDTGSSSPDKPTADRPASHHVPSLAPPRSDSVNADALGDGQSSSKDTQIDLSPPSDDAKAHPQSSDLLIDADAAGAGNGDVSEFHPWDPHKAAKDVEVGDFYFKRKNYHAAEDRYREALLYKNNDAVATFRLAVCLEKLDLPEDARKEYESYLRILPRGPQAEQAQKAIDRLRGPAASAKSVK
jgi:tetratricopeptide (TPR) repeat protein